MAGRRIVGYDIAKTLAMFLVVMLHYAFYTRYYAGGIAGTLVTTACVVCVPLFFAVNGALLLPRPLDVRRHYRKLAMIVGIVAVWKTLCAVFFVCCDGSQHVTAGDYVRFLLGGQFGAYPAGYFWFMNALIAVYAVYPVLKLAFDDPSRVALRVLVAVIAAFTVGKDTLGVLLDMFGRFAGHDLAGLLGGLGEFYLFGQYGYVALYFLVGGIIGRRFAAADGEDRALPSAPVCWVTVVLCYVLSFGIQRYQHAAHGTNLTIESGYWLLPTFAGTVALLCLCMQVRRLPRWIEAMVEAVGANTFGVYMLHLMAIVLFSQVQGAVPAFAALAAMPGWLATLVNLGCVAVLFAVCAAVAWLLRKVPAVGRLFAL